MQAGTTENMTKHRHALAENVITWSRWCCECVCLPSESLYLPRLSVFLSQRRLFCGLRTNRDSEDVLTTGAHHVANAIDGPP